MMMILSMALAASTSLNSAPAPDEDRVHEVVLRHVMALHPAKVYCVNVFGTSVHDKIFKRLRDSGYRVVAAAECEIERRVGYLGVVVHRETRSSARFIQTTKFRLRGDGAATVSAREYASVGYVVSGSSVTYDVRRAPNGQWVVVGASPDRAPLRIGGS